MAGAASEPVLSTSTAAVAHADAHDGPRRDLLRMTLAATLLVGLCAAAWPFLDAMDPSHDLMAKGAVSVDLAAIPAGSGVTVLWEGKPVLVRHLTPAELTDAENYDVLLLRDPETALSRVKTHHPDWAVLDGAGKDGCVVSGNQPSDNRGQFGGWVSPCDGSQYDVVGRVRSGPAKRNLGLPPYDFSAPTKITIG